MAVTVTNLYQKLVIKLKTNLPSDPTLYYYLSHTELVTGIPTSTGASMSATGERDGNIITYTIPFKDFSIGDELRNFNCKWTGNHSILSMQDGVSILIDGEESPVIKTSSGNPVTENNNYVMINPLNQSQFALVFSDTDVHTVQAIYKGTQSIGVALSEKAIISPQIRTEHEELPNVEGTYVIEFTKYKNSMQYMDDVEWEGKLTKGGTPVPDALIQLDIPIGTYTLVTDADGIFKFRRTHSTMQINPNQVASLREWHCGSYTIQARYHYYDESNDSFEELICKTIKPLTVTKSEPLLVVDTYAQTRTGVAKFQLTDPQGFPLVNHKLVCVVNGKTYNKSTNDGGKIAFNIGITGTVTYKITYMGNNDYDSKTWNFSEVIGD